MKAIKCCKINLMQWRIQPKYMLVLVFLVLRMMGMILPYKEFAVDTGFKIAPYLLVALVRSSNWYMLFMLAYILLICDAPFMNRQQQFVLQRTGKVTWLRGQLLYLVVLSLSVTLLTWVLSWVFLLPHVDWTAQWGTGIQSATRYPSQFSVYPPYLFPLYILKNWTGIEAMAWVLLMQFLIGLFLGELVLVCNLWSKRGLGVAISAMLLLLSYMVSGYATTAGNIKRLIYLSPLSWMDLSLFGDTSVNQPPLEYALVMLLLLCVGLAALALSRIHKSSLDMDKE